MSDEKPCAVSIRIAVDLWEKHKLGAEREKDSGLPGPGRYLESEPEQGEDVEIEEFGKMDELHHYGHSKPFLGLEELCRWAEATIKRLEGEKATVRGWYVKTARQEVRTYTQLTEARKLLERVVSNMRIHDAIPPKITTDIRDFLKGGEADDDES